MATQTPSPVVRRNRFHFFIITAACAGLACAAAVLMLCNRDIVNNPYDPGYVGDYDITVAWPSTPLTAKVFTRYRFGYSTGRDAFEKVGIMASEAGVVDSGLFAAELTADSLTVYFRKAFTGMLYAQGTTPNGRPFRDSVRVTVTNPYTVIGPAVAARGTTVCLRVTREDGFGAAAPLVDWRCNDSAYAKYANESLCLLMAGNGLHAVTAVVNDGRGNSLALDTFFVSVPGAAPAVTAASFYDDTVAVGDTGRLMVAVDDADGGWLGVFIYAPSLGWLDSASFVSRTGKPDTVVFSRRLTGAGHVEALVWVRDETGLCSDTARDTTICAAYEYYHELSLVEEPQRLVINRPARWRVAAGPADRVARYSPSVEWLVTAGLDDTLLDTTGAGLDSAVVIPRDSTGVRLTVRLADAGGRISRRIERIYDVRLYRPWCSIAYAPDTIGNFVADSLRITCGDSVGTVIARRVVVTKNSAALIDTTFHPDTALRVSFADSGLYSVAAWVMDDDLLVSDTARTAIRVRPVQYIPHVTAVTISPASPYNGDWVTLCADVERAQPDVAIVRTRWDFDGDTASWEIDTSGLCGGKRFSTPGSHLFSVVCVDSLGRQSPRYHASATVADGKPVITSFTPATVWFNDDTIFSVYVQDPNSSIKQITINWGDGTAPVSRNVSASPILEQFNHRYASWGLYDVTVTAVDDSLQSVSRQFQVHAKKGQPSVRIKGSSSKWWGSTLSGDTLYANVDSSRYSNGHSWGASLKVDFFDTNGVAKKYYLSRNRYLDTVSNMYSCSLNTAEASWYYTTYYPLPDSMWWSGDSSWNSNTSTSRTCYPCGSTGRMAFYALDDDGLIAGDTVWFKIRCW